MINDCVINTISSSLTSDNQFRECIKEKRVKNGTSSSHDIIDIVAALFVKKIEWVSKLIITKKEYFKWIQFLKTNTILIQKFIRIKIELLKYIIVWNII